jgi:hypothetical protein
MTHPATDYVLSAIKDNWSAGSYADIPLERVDGDTSEDIADNLRTRTSELQDANYVEAQHTDRTDRPVGSEYDLHLDDPGLVVSVSVTGLHRTKHGCVDPDASLPPATAGDPVPFYDLRKEIVRTIHAEKGFPDTSSSIDYTDLQVINRAPLSYEYGDYYRYDFDVAFGGFEQL